MVNPELSKNVNAKDIKKDRLNVVGGVRREKKLVGIGDKEREGSGKVLVLGIGLQDC